MRSSIAYYKAPAAEQYGPHHESTTYTLIA